MKREAWIALGVMALMVVVFFLIFGTSNRQVEESLVVEVPDLERIEIVGADGAEGPDLVVLQLRDGRWWLTHPVEARVDRRSDAELTAIFSRPIRTDDLIVDADRAETYGLSDDSAVRISLFGAGAERPARELLVGRDMVVPQTGAQRTFIQPLGEDRIYRAHGAFGELVRRDIGNLRDRTILSVGEGGIESIRISHRDGHHVEVASRGDRWTMVGPAIPYRVDQQRAMRLASSLGRLEAVDFYDERAGGPGFEEPDVVVDLVTRNEEIRLEVARVHHGDQTRYLLRRQGVSALYEISRSDADMLMVRLFQMRDRSLLATTSARIDQIRLAGDERVHLIRRDGRWVMEEPAGMTVDAEAATRLAQFIAAISVESWLEEQPLAQDVGLEPRDRRTVRIGIDGAETALQLGHAVDETGRARYARYSEAPDIFILSESTVRRLTQDSHAFRLDEPSTSD